MKIRFSILPVATMSLFLATNALAQSTPEISAPSLAFKLTPSYYRISDGNNAADLNLRANYGDNVGWIGYYRDRLGFQQARAGYENHTGLGAVRLVLSAQAASRGFWGGAANAEIGGDTFAIVGFGRTNLRDYYNLNFDPNDAITLGAGTRAIRNTELSLYMVRDDRLGTGQRVTHLIARRAFAGKQRLTLDLSHKSGQRTAGNTVVGSGITLTDDYAPWFVRAAYDPYVNFTGNRMTLFALGRRF
ncbi:hypothetical protein TPL01_10900 [Sulfuriferula plumbiphila]|uniref:Uncharacterized protein n=1 Tax=Sulfuriferula plumbiphila TaxID=171865 RepID=A0A512L670_9PROT|nr:hypothetical protein [Sulfuriferula plumbiphila]BBP03551.1 hypothetical protein SFPGR_09730 [Sulfuriferula plumbiphila]GEP29952.1 hypothetical protein TPL01_10900 [Sulfuriferula plumbiphila]